MLSNSLPTQIDDISATLDRISNSDCRGLGTAANYLLMNLSDKTTREFFTEHYNEVAHSLINEYQSHSEVQWFVDECIPAIQALLPTDFPSHVLKRSEKLTYNLPNQPQPPLTTLYSMQKLKNESEQPHSELLESHPNQKHCCYVI